MANHKFFQPNVAIKNYTFTTIFSRMNQQYTSYTSNFLEIKPQINKK